MKFSAGDKVIWKTSRGINYGHVVKKIETDVSKGVFEIHASRDDPAYIVRSEASGRLAAHRSDELCKD